MVERKDLKMGLVGADDAMSWEVSLVGCPATAGEINDSICYEEKHAKNLFIPIRTGPYVSHTLDGNFP